MPVAVVAHEQMSEWLGRLDEAGLSASGIVAENYGLARIPGTMSMMAAENQIMFNDGADNEFVLQGAMPSDALAVVGALEESDNEDQVPGHLLVYCSPDDEQRYQHDWNALRHELASVDINLLPDGVLPRLAVTVAAGSGVNLLQGRYGPKTEVGALFRPWRYAAILFLTLGVLAFGGKVADYYRLTQEEVALKAQFEQVYHLDDLLFRRTHIGNVLPNGGLSEIKYIKDVCSKYLDWSEEKWQKEICRYQKIWKTSYSLPECN